MRPFKLTLESLRTIEGRAPTVHLVAGCGRAGIACGGARVSPAAIVVGLWKKRGLLDERSCGVAV